MPATELTESPSLLAGRYRVLERIGSGGIATVFLAEDELLRRRVAIKRLRAEGVDDADRRRILREARLGACLSHPCLATIFDVVAGEEETLVVMEHVRGRPLSDLIPADGLDPDRLVEILRPVASALDHAHRHGVVHRDVKPSNILVGDAGAVRLVDLGAAIALGASRITAENEVVGTLAYIAPERLTGEEPGGPPADIYSLGVTAFEALTGSVPIRARTVREALAEIDEGGPPRLRDRWPAAPGALCLALSQAMQRDPGRRHRSATELVAQIDVALKRATPVRPPLPEPRPVPAARPAPGDGAAPARGRRLWPVAAAAAAVAAIAAAAIALSGGGGGGAAGRGHATAGSRSPGKPGANHHPRASPSPSASASAAASPASASASAPAGTSASPPDPALGAQLNDRGYALIQSGQYAAAVPILRRAVREFPPGSGSLTYGYALFNLAHALRLSGHPAAAIPLLERRLRIPDQIATVQAELAAARAAAGQGG